MQAVTAPLVSVIMPVFNAARYLAASMRSILEQTFDDFEFIVVDDGSRDGSQAILRSFAAVDSRVRVLAKSHAGIVAALNDGLSVARGEFVARMDGDDLVRRDRLARQLRRMHNDSALVALGSCALAIDPDGRPLGPAPVPLNHQEIDENHLEGHSSMYHPSVMVRRTALEQVGGYRDLCPCEDIDLWLRLAEIGRLGNLRQSLFIWRRRSDGLVGCGRLQRNLMLSQALKDAWSRRALSGQPPSLEPHFPRPGDIYQQWAWMALDSNQPRTARRYAVKALCSDPWNSAAWKLAACALRGS